MLLRVMGKISALGYDACLTCIISTEAHSGTPPVVGEIEYRQESKSGGQNSIREPLQDSSVGIARSRFDCLIVPALRANSVITARNPGNHIISSYLLEGFLIRSNRPRYSRASLGAQAFSTIRFSCLRTPKEFLAPDLPPEARVHRLHQCCSSNNPELRLPSLLTVMRS